MIFYLLAKWKKVIVIENQMTFSENTKEKVNCLYLEIGEEYICIGDDSGISIDALDGFPGVHTARWMNADDHMKNLELLKRLENVPKNKRQCHYTTVIAIKGKEIDKIFECCHEAQRESEKQFYGMFIDDGVKLYRHDFCDRRTVERSLSDVVREVFIRTEVEIKNV